MGKERGKDIVFQWTKTKCRLRLKLSRDGRDQPLSLRVQEVYVHYFHYLTERYN